MNFLGAANTAQAAQQMPATGIRPVQQFPGTPNASGAPPNIGNIGMGMMGGMMAGNAPPQSPGTGMMGGMQRGLQALHPNAIRDLRNLPPGLLQHLHDAGVIHPGLMEHVHGGMMR
jgi:hypothetical protein